MSRYVFLFAALLALAACASGPGKYGATTLSLSAGESGGIVDVIAAYSTDAALALDNVGAEQWFARGRTLPTSAVTPPDAWSFEVVPSTSITRSLVYKERPEAVFVFVQGTDAHGAPVYRNYVWAKDRDRFRAPGFIEGLFVDPPGEIDISFSNGEVTVSSPS